MSTDIDYHLGRWRAERDIAYGAALSSAADAHMSLSALHLQRALLLHQVRTQPIGNVTPFRVAPASSSECGISDEETPAMDLQA